MARRFSIGKLSRFFGFLRPRWGVRGSLFAAFAVIAGMAIVISAGAGLVLGHLGGAMVPVARALGMDVVAWSQNLTPERCAELGIAQVTKDELLSSADILGVFLSSPSAPVTRCAPTIWPG